MSVNELLKRHGWTILGAAEALEVDPSTLYRWAKGCKTCHEFAVRYLIEHEDPRDYLAAFSGEPGTYIVKAGKLVKIGSTTDIDRRVRKLQTANGYELELLAYSTALDEEAVHARFSQHHKRGEWFYADEDILAFAKKVGTLQH